MIRVVVTGIVIVHTKAFLRLPGFYSGCVQPSGEGQIPSFSFIVNDIKNFVFGLAEATVYGSCKSRKQKFVMSFTIV